MGAERDWVRVVAEQRCPECGFEGRTVSRGDLGPGMQAAAAGWAVLLAGTGPAELRAHRPGGGWSALEYGCHVRDVLGLFAARVEQARDHDGCELGWWDHEAAVVDDDYAAADPGPLAGTIGANAARMAQVLDSLTGAQWSHRATRRGSEAFTVEGLARFALHEARHHLVDAQELLGGAAG